MHIVSPQQNSARIAPLAVLPVFFDLTGKRVIAIGGSEPATWKIELLAAAGANVQVLAPIAEWCDDLIALAESGAAAGSISLVDCRWAPSDLSGAALAVADIEDDAEAVAFTEAARDAAVPYNVIDRPEFCQFQFGSIVNRSPVVVGISTAGAAPILGQAVRRRIETLLPQTLSGWAQLAHDIRGKVMQTLEAGPQRRAFWERFTERAFTTRADSVHLEGEIAAIAAAPPVGRVTLVGAGPGDADLLTIKAVRALQSADVILFDDLVSPEVLELARREAKRLLVGKRAARESCRQEDINEMMLSLAHQGKHVVRLKSGDPMIFGRAGEEIEMLESHGIAVSVVPGITTALALASRLGISLTHRDHAQSVRFVTGHSRRGTLPETLDWRALADPATTNVYYMSRRTLPDIVHQLAARGMSLDTPAIIAGNVGRSDEQIWRGNIGSAVLAAEAFPLSAPTIFAVGNALLKAAEAHDDHRLRIARPACCNSSKAAKRRSCHAAVSGCGR